MNFPPLILGLTAAVAMSALLSAQSIPLGERQAVDESPTAKYRDWHLRMALADAAKQASMDASEAKLISSRPERIEELHWRSGASSSKPDSVREILFRFDNGQLFEMNITYEREQTNGLTDADMTEALSAVYGSSSAPTAKEMSFNSGYENTVRIVAQWGAGQDLVRLVVLPYQGGYGLVVSSAAIQNRARAAIMESNRLDRVEAPQRERDLMVSQAADAKTKNEKSRLLNKPGFRP